MRALDERPFYRYIVSSEKCKAGNPYKGLSPSARIVELTTGKAKNRKLRKCE